MAWTQYEGKDLFLFHPNWTDNIDQGFRHPYDLLQWIGKGYCVDNFNETILKFTAQFLIEGKENIRDFIQFFDDQMGRLGGFWLPSWQSDIVVTVSFLGDATELTIEDIDYEATYLPNDATGRHIFVKFPDDTEKYKAITNADADTNTITIDSTIGKDCSVDHLPHLLVSFLYFVRFDQDEIELKYISDSIITSKISFATIPHEAPAII